MLKQKIKRQCWKKHWAPRCTKWRGWGILNLYTDWPWG